MIQFKPYPAYKDAGAEWLGAVPEHWKIAPLKRCCNVFPSNVDKKSYEGQREVFLCNYTDVYYNKTISAHKRYMQATATDDQIERFQLQARDVIFTKDSETADDIAIAAYVPESIPGLICGYHLAIARPYECIDGKFVKCYIDSRAAKAYFAVSANGLTRVGLSQYSIDNLPMPVPPASEQTQIARFLDHETVKIDALIAEQQRLIELLKEKRQAVISHAVTKGLDPNVPMKDSGVEWLGEVPAHWAASKLKFMTDRVVDCPHETPVYDPDGDYLVIRTADLDQGVLKPEGMYRLQHGEYLNRTRRSSLIKNDVVYGREGERWGHAALVPESDFFALGQRMMQFRVGAHICPEFFMYQLNSVPVYRQGEVDTVGATAPHVNISTIINYQMTVPPVTEQSQISLYLDGVLHVLDSLIAESIGMANLLRERRSALISAAVTGRIDVRGWRLPAAPQTENQTEAALG